MGFTRIACHEPPSSLPFASSVRPHSSLAAEVESAAGQVFEDYINGDVTREEGIVRPFALQTYSCEGVRLKVFSG